MDWGEGNVDCYLAALLTLRVTLSQILHSSEVSNEFSC